MTRLSGRIAVVTGGAGGLGQAIAARLALEGADIAVADTKEAAATGALVQKAGRRFVSRSCDIADPSSVTAFATAVHDEIGPVDIVVNNAAIMTRTPFEDVTFDLWQRFFAVNVHGQFLMAKAFLDDLKQSSAGRIISIASASFWRSIPLMSPYVTAKGATLGFVNSLATELGPHGVTVNAVAPGIVRTPGMTALDGADETFERVTALQVIKRQQQPQDAAGVVAFLASDDASFITGQVIVADGGLTRR